jgi:hypothetical protein
MNNQMQLIHSITLTSLVIIGSCSTIFHYREKPLRDVAVASALLAAASAAKLVDPSSKETVTALTKSLWGYLSIF